MKDEKDMILTGPPRVNWRYTKLQSLSSTNESPWQGAGDHDSLPPPLLDPKEGIPEWGCEWICDRRDLLQW